MDQAPLKLRLISLRRLRKYRPTMPSSLEQRCAASEAVVAKMRSAGVTLDDDPAVGDLIDQWINGQLAMADVLREYQQLLENRQSRRRGAEGFVDSAERGEGL